MKAYRRSHTVTVAALLAACQAHEMAPFPHSALTLVESSAWPGEQIHLTGFGPGDPESRLAVLVGPDTVEALRLDLHTAAFPAPAVPGRYRVRVLTAPGSQDLEDLTVVGFSGTWPGPEAAWYLTPWPMGGPPRVLATGLDKLFLFDLSSRSIVATYPNSLFDPQCSRVPGPSYRPNVWALTSCGTAGMWTLLPRPQLVGRPPSRTMRLYAEIGPGQWLFAYHHYIEVWSVVDGAVVGGGQYVYEETDGVRISPRGDRAITIVNGASAAGGVPVFDGATGALAYTVAQLARSSGAAFTPDGDTLFVVGRDSAYGARLVVLDAVGGTVLTSVAFDTITTSPTEGVWDVTVDPLQPWLYVSGYEDLSDDPRRPELVPLIRVFSRCGLPILVGTVRAPDRSYIGSRGWQGTARLVASPFEGAFYFMTEPSISLTIPTRIYRFDVVQRPGEGSLAAGCAPERN